MSREQLEALATDLNIKYNKHTPTEDIGFAILDVEAKAESLKPVPEKPKRGKAKKSSVIVAADDDFEEFSIDEINE